MKTLVDFPSYTYDGGVMYQGDCLEIMPLLADKSVDLVLTDPPYGDGISYGRLDKTIIGNEDETINYKILPTIYDKLKEGGGMLPIY